MSDNAERALRLIDDLIARLDAKIARLDAKRVTQIRALCPRCNRIHWFSVDSPCQTAEDGGDRRLYQAVALCAGAGGSSKEEQPVLTRLIYVATANFIYYYRRAGWSVHVRTSHDGFDIRAHARGTSYDIVFGVHGNEMHYGIA